MIKYKYNDFEIEIFDDEEYLGNLAKDKNKHHLTSFGDFPGNPEKDVGYDDREYSE